MTEDTLKKGVGLLQDMRTLWIDINYLNKFMKNEKFSFDTRSADIFSDVPIPTETARSIIQDLIDKKQKEHDELKKQFNEL